MPRELHCDKPESLQYRDYTLPKLAAGEIRVAAEFAAIKHGTEFFLFSGKSPFAGREFDMNQRMFVESKKKEEPFMYRPGNMVVGTVSEAGAEVKDYKPGDKVYGYSALREIATLDASRVKPLPGLMTPTDAVCTDPSWFGFAAVRDAKVRVGDAVVVLGLGAIGLLAVQFLKLCGCVEIIAFDPIDKRRKLAERYGATLTADPIKQEPGAVVHDHLGGRGADAALEISGNYQALQSSLRCVGMCGRVVTVGYYKGNNSPIQLSMEWHHNRLELISSMPDWENPDRDYPAWDKKRLQDTIVRLFCEKKLTSEGIVDPIVSFDGAKDGYMGVYRDPNSSVKMGVKF